MMMSRKRERKDGEEDEVCAARKISELIELEGEGDAERNELICNGYQPCDGEVVVVEDVNRHIGWSHVVLFVLRGELGS